MSLRDKSAPHSTCYEKAEGIPALRFDLENGESYAFPYIHLQFARMTIADESQSLEIQYSSHLIEILGSGLTTLLTAIQKTELLSLSQTSLSRGTRSGVVVYSILVQSVPRAENESEQ